MNIQIRVTKWVCNLKPHLLKVYVTGLGEPSQGRISVKPATLNGFYDDESAPF